MKKENHTSLDPLLEDIGVVIHNKDGSVTYIQDPFLKGMKWKGVSVNSKKFTSLSAHEKLFMLSQEFLGAAISLCQRAGEAGPALTWPQGSVVYYCLHLATELFLKACLVRKKVSLKTLNHEVADLLREYERAFPEEADHFTTPWQSSAREINQMLGNDVITGVDSVPDQLFRYSMNKGGIPSKSVHFFTPSYLYNYMSDLEDKWSKTWKWLNEKSEG